MHPPLHQPAVHGHPDTGQVDEGQDDLQSGPLKGELAWKVVHEIGTETMAVSLEVSRREWANNPARGESARSVGHVGEPDLPGLEGVVAMEEQRDTGEQRHSTTEEDRLEGHHQAGLPAAEQADWIEDSLAMSQLLLPVCRPASRFRWRRVVVKIRERSQPVYQSAVPALRPYTAVADDLATRFAQADQHEKQHDTGEHGQKPEHTSPPEKLGEEAACDRAEDAG